MFSLLIQIFIFSLLILFLILTLRILVVFFVKSTKSKELNRSVAKSVFGGKLSLIIILVFYGISFSLVGGANLASKGFEKTLTKQFSDNNVFQAEADRKSGIINIYDNFAIDSSILYNKKWASSLYEIEDNLFISPWVIDHTLTTETISHFTTNIFNENRFEKIELKNGDYVDPIYIFNNKLFSDSGFSIDDTTLTIENSIHYDNDGNKINISDPEYRRSFGWTKSEYEEAIEYQIENYFETGPGQNFSKNWSYSEDIDESFYKYLFDGDYKRYADTIIELKIFNNIFEPLNSFSDSAFYNQVDEEIKEKIIEYNDQISFRFLEYINVSPKNISNENSNVDFEFVVYNDIDFVNGKLFNSVDDIENDLFNKYVDTPVNQTTFLNKSYNDFILSENDSENEINILVQQDYLENTNQKIGDYLDVSFSNSELNPMRLKIYDSVRFNEITYPMMGFNLLPNKEKQSFLGIRLSDFIRFSASTKYSSYYNRYLSPFITTELGRQNLDSSKKWIEFDGELDKVNDWLNEYITYISDHWVSIYNIPIDEFNDYLEQFDDWKIIRNYYSMDENYSNDNFIGTSLIYDSFHVVTEFESIEANRLLFGVFQISNTQKIINVIVLIFISVILIVLSILIIKRIKSSGKQLGTLKAMGMKNSIIAISYVTFPLIIITIGFFIALILSPLVMLGFNSLFGSFYYINFLASPFSLSFFVLVFFLPLVLSVSITYLISLSILRKPTLDLLNNKSNYSPNVFVRALGYFTPQKTPFFISYTSKGLFKAIGKSTLLFISIFAATLLIGFSMSSTTMTKNQTENALDYLNFDLLSRNNVYNSGQYNTVDLYKEIENSDGTIEYIESYKELDGDGNVVNEISGFDNITYLTIINSINSISDKASFDTTYNNVMNQIKNKFTNLKISYSIDNGAYSNEYISKNLMEQLVLLKFLFNNKYLNLNLENSFNYYEKNNVDLDILTFQDLSKLINNWILNLGVNLSKENNNFFNQIDNLADLSTEDLINFFNEIKNYETDVVFGTQYYNSYNQVSLGSFDIYPAASAINIDKDIYNNYWSNWNLEDDLDEDSEFKTLNLIYNEKEFFNSYGRTKELGEQIWNDSFGKYSVDDSELTDYIPVIVTTQTRNWLEEQVAEGNIFYQGDDIYTVAISVPTLTKGNDENANLINLDSYNYSLEYNSILIDLKIEYELYVIIDFGFNAYKPYVEKYFDNYEYKNNDQGILQNDGSFWYKEKTSYNYFQAFYQYYGVNDDEKALNNYSFLPKNYQYNVFNPKNDIPESISDDKRIISATSIVIDESAFGSVVDVYDESNPITIDYLNNPDLYFDDNNNFNFNNSFNLSYGISIPVLTLLNQGQVIYKIIILTFDFLSIFIIFISTTIILIAVKDILDSSKREISMLKTFGYSNFKSTTLIMFPYLIIVIFAFLLAIPLTFVGLSVIANLLMALTGNIFIFELSLLQWILLMIYVIGIILFLFLIGYISFFKTNALEAVKETNE